MTTTDFAALAERLRARSLALVRARARRPARPERWRRAAWLWPLFPKG